VYITAKEFMRLVHTAKIGDAEIRDQTTRAAKSTFFRLSEGLPAETAGMRRKYFTLATESLCEAVAGCDAAATLGLMPEADAVKAHEIGKRLKKMLRALLHSR
jgi:four helix bundle protein